MMKGRSERGRKARARGHWAEGLAALWLRCKGYRILARNWRSPVGEIDILAQKRGMLVLVEVKSRADHRAAAEAIHPHQRARLLRAFGHYLQLHPQWQSLDQRCDCILIGRGFLPRHIKNVWQ